MTGERQTVSLGWPPENADALRSFPRRALASAQELWRVVRRRRGPWWFASAAGGRFDLQEPDGTSERAERRHQPAGEAPVVDAASGEDLKNLAKPGEHPVAAIELNTG